MWRSILLGGILLAAPAMGWCDNVQFTVDPANMGTAISGPGEIDLFSTGLNGMTLAGQTLSLNLMFSSNVLARLFLSDPSAFGIELEVHTNAGTFPGFAGPTTGYLLGANGNPFGGTQTAGSEDSSDGSFGVGLVSFTAGNLSGVNAVDISGVHFDLTMPSTGFAVTDAQLRFSMNDAYDAVEFGTAQQLPEPSTLGLTLLGGLMAAFAAGRRARR